VVVNIQQQVVVNFHLVASQAASGASVSAGSTASYTYVPSDKVLTAEALQTLPVFSRNFTFLSQVLAGTLKSTGGQVLVATEDLTCRDPDCFTSAGVGRIPEDRHEGVVGELTVAENLALEHLDEFVDRGLLDNKKILLNAEKLISEYQIKASPTDRARTLSGGNLQKVILARVLSRNPQVVIASQPTRGLDVGATEYVRSQLLEQRDRGAAILLISEDLDEVVALSDRIAVIYEGRIVKKLPIFTWHFWGKFL
jgi:ABC-type uncharacterized transport system ATPase subunit